MSRVETLLRSSRPEIAPCSDHRDQLRRRIEIRATEGGIAGFLSRRPEFAVLVLSASMALVLWILSLTAASISPLPRSFDGPAMETGTRNFARIAAAPGRFGIVSYARMFLPRTQTTDIATLQRVLAKSMLDRQAAQRIVEGR